MQSSQINAPPAPATSSRTCERGLPQNEHVSTELGSRGASMAPLYSPVVAACRPERSGVRLTPQNVQNWSALHGIVAAALFLTTVRDGGISADGTRRGVQARPRGEDAPEA